MQIETVKTKKPKSTHGKKRQVKTEYPVFSNDQLDALKKLKEDLKNNEKNNGKDL
jgi:hypothetical protein